MKNILIIRIFTRKIRRINDYKLRLIKKLRGEEIERLRRNKRGRGRGRRRGRERERERKRERERDGG